MRAYFPGVSPGSGAGSAKRIVDRLVEHFPANVAGGAAGHGGDRVSRGQACDHEAADCADCALAR